MKGRRPPPADRAREDTPPGNKCRQVYHGAGARLALPWSHMKAVHADPADSSSSNPVERGADAATLSELRVPPALIGFLLILVVVMAVIFLAAAQNVHTL